ncbi:MAG: leader peptidase (prepilin peptidase) / N-methyltransferase [Actinomycetota bacterium]|nr:leader peptidase (prepilin peptidase) / N-methyltransferase [Actinomycetota bacterium]
MTWDAYWIIVATIAGLIFGSFATVVAYRVPRRETIVTGRSKCPSCGAQIAWYDNIPIVGYLLLRGKCRNCGVHIAARYLWIELTTGISWALLVWRFGLSFEVAIYAAFFWVLVVLTAIDLEHNLLPNRIVYPTFVVGWIALVAHALIDGDPASLVGAAVGALTFGGFLFTVAFIAPAGMGGGDVKLGFVLGTFLGYAGGASLTLVGMFLSFLLGGVIGIALLMRGEGRKAQVPFGPFLAAGTVLAVLWGHSILDWYLG